MGNLYEDIMINIKIYMYDNVKEKSLLLPVSFKKFESGKTSIVSPRNLGVPFGASVYFNTSCNLCFARRM